MSAHQLSVSLAFQADSTAETSAFHGGLKGGCDMQHAGLGEASELSLLSPVEDAPSPPSQLQQQLQQQTATTRGRVEAVQTER